MIHLREIFKYNFNEIAELHVADHQVDQIATNAYSLAEAHYTEDAWIRGIYYDETPVGFVMLSLNHDEHIYKFWRIMIDQNHQGKGYAKSVITEVIEFIKTLPEAKEIFAQFNEKENADPGSIYRHFGFLENGTLDGFEHIHLLKLAL